MSESTRSLTDLFGMLSPRRATDAAPATEPPVTSAPEASYATKALRKFLTSLQGVENPLLLLRERALHEENERRAAENAALDVARRTAEEIGRAHV